MPNQKGFAPVLLVFAVAAVGVLFISANRLIHPITQNVAGLEVTKGENPPLALATDASNSVTTRNKKVVEVPKKGRFELNVSDGEFDIEAEDGATESSAEELESADVINAEINQENVELTGEGDFINLKLGSVQAKSNFPLIIDQTTGQLMVITPNGERAIRVLPDFASQIAQEAGVQNKIESLEILPSTSTTDSVVFKVTGAKVGSLLGLIAIDEPVEIEVGAQTGKIVSINQPFWLRLFSPLIR